MTEPNSPDPAAASGGASDSAESAKVDAETLRERVVATLKTCYDPEIPVDIYELGLIYDIAIDETSSVKIEMTLTSPACPVAGTLPPEIETKVGQTEGVKRSTVEVVWDPPWTPERMTEAAKLELGMF